MTLDELPLWLQQGKFQQSIVLDTGKVYGKQLFLDCMPQVYSDNEFSVAVAMLRPCFALTVMVSGCCCCLS